MALDKVDRIRGVIMFVVAWLIGLYVYEVVQEYAQGPLGLVAGVVTLVVNLYARRRATMCDPGTWVFKFWLYLPVILFLLVPIIAKVIIFLVSEEELRWWQHLFSLLPFVLKLGVPVGALLGVYWALGRMVAPAEEAGDAGEAAVTPQ